MNTETVFSELTNIGNELSEGRKCAVLIALKLDDLKERLAVRDTEITPETGWGGKNAEERKLSQDKAMHEDRKASNLMKGVKRLLRMARLQAAYVEGLEDRRRALEYTAQLILKTEK